MHNYCTVPLSQQELDPIYTHLSLLPPITSRLRPCVPASCSIILHDARTPTSTALPALLGHSLPTIGAVVAATQLIAEEETERQAAAADPTTDADPRGGEPGSDAHA